DDKSTNGICDDDCAAKTETPAGWGDGSENGLRSSSEIHVTLPAPTVVLPGCLADPRHLVVRPRYLRFSTWTGGEDDGSAPPQLEHCSPTGPMARHMVLQARGTEISLGCGRPSGSLVPTTTDEIS
ncbi:unnamed protein product, partial [Laminaria digitata]